MKVIRVHAFGGVDALVYEEVPPPVPADGQVLVRVKAAAVGPWNAWVRSGTTITAGSTLRCGGFSRICG